MKLENMSDDYQEPYFVFWQSCSNLRKLLKKTILKMKRVVERSEISQFYGTFCEEESLLRLNLRHYAVFHHLVKAGLKPTNKVLEIGCGFGTITYLMAKYLKRGKIVATDISSERIASCIRNFEGQKNVSFVLSDMKDFVSEQKFDMIVLPDVLEHIPVENHPELFKLMESLLNDSGSIVIHIPHPAAIEYYQRTCPEKLQIIDQSIATDILTKTAMESGMRLELLRSYALASHPYDYQLIVFKKNISYHEMAQSGKMGDKVKEMEVAVLVPENDHLTWEHH